MERRRIKKLACEPTIFQVVTHAEKYGTPLADLGPSIDWPWWVHQLVIYVGTVRSIYERAGISKSEIPPRYIWWDPDKLNEYFDRQREH